MNRDLTTASEAERLLASHPDTRYLDFFFADLCGVVRGKRYPIADLGKALESGLGLTGSAFLMSATGEVLDPHGLGISDGDPDAVGRVVPGTLAPMPWAELPTAQALLTFFTPENEPYYYEPRHVLQRVLTRFAECRLHPMVAFELEFYLTDPVRDADGLLRPPRSPDSGERYTDTQVYGMADVEEFAELLGDIAGFCDAQNVRTGAITAEYAPGQFEINLHHGPDPLRSADECVMFKRVVQGAVRRRGLRATFMPKPFPDQAGSGLHLHVSLFDEAGKNVFDGGGPTGQPGCASDTLRHAIGGVCALMPESMAVFAPNINGFRRFRPNLFVPVGRSWGFENRSTSVRIPTGDGASRRIEHRVAGADANPYLTLAALLAGIHHGIERKIDPGPPAAGNASVAMDPEVPFRQRAALDRMAQGEVIREYFGEEYVLTYTECKHRELDAFEDVMSRKEIDWYLNP